MPGFFGLLHQEVMESWVGSRDHLGHLVSFSCYQGENLSPGHGNLLWARRNDQFNILWRPGTELGKHGFVFVFETGMDM